LLLLILVLSVWLAWQVNRAHKQRRALALIEALGGRVWFDYQLVQPHDPPILAIDDNNEPPVPAWLRNTIGEEYFRKVIAVDLSERPVGDDDLDLLADLPHVLYVYITDTSIGDRGVAQIATHAPQLKGLDADRTRITDNGLESIGTLRQLHLLSLISTPISDDGLKHLAHLTQMRQLLLDRTRISDAGLVHLSKMVNIDEWLGLAETRITDKGLKHLTHFVNARSINLLRSYVTNQGGYWLTQQLPKCHVSYAR
jgi:hypothetical protein